MKAIVKRVIILVVIVALVIVYWQSGLANFLNDLNKFREFILGFGIWGYVIYFLLYIASCILMLPGSFLTIFGGIVFGPVYGGLISLFAATAGASVAFIISRYLARDLIVNRLGKNPIFIKIDEGVKNNGISFLILTRLVPVFPFNIQNYAYGFTAIKLSSFALVSLITMAPGSFIYAYLAGDIVSNGVSLSLLLKFSIAGVTLFLISFIARRVAQRLGIGDFGK